jgi:FixJ family two-component response regulator
MNKVIFRVSVVDDSDIVRHAFSATLEHAGYCVTEFASGKEFLASDSAQQSDCILLDLDMPGQNGIDILDAMQDLGWKTPVIIVITGTANPALLAGADRDIVTTILKKPIGPDALLAALAEACQPSSNS